MSGKPAKIELCPECRNDNGWHWSDDLVQVGTRPHHAAARQAAEVQALSAAAHEQAMEAAKQIVRDTARRYAQFSANDARAEMEAAGVPSGCIGAAFTAVSKEKHPAIEHSGRHVMSTEESTRHRIGVWTSLIYGKRAA